MDFLNTEDSEKETISRALAGDHEAGREALLRCQIGLVSGKLSETMAFYLAARLHDVLEGIKPDRALCIAKPAIKPLNPSPEWKLQLAAFAGILKQRGYKPQQVAAAMRKARKAVFNRTLDNSDALKIAKIYPQLDARNLHHLAGPYREILEGYSPVD